jgi:hypothetical protein
MMFVRRADQLIVIIAGLCVNCSSAAVLMQDTSVGTLPSGGESGVGNKAGGRSGSNTTPAGTAGASLGAAGMVAAGAAGVRGVAGSGVNANGGAAAGSGGADAAGPAAGAASMNPPSGAGDAGGAAGARAAVGGNGGTSGNLAGVGGGSAGTSGTGGTGGTPSSPRVPMFQKTACIDPMQAMPDTEVNFPCQGVDIWTVVPSACRTRACGLIFNIHGGGMSDHATMDQATNMIALGSEGGYIVVHPHKGTWSVASDKDAVFGFLQQVITAFDVDRKRVHSTGYSQGGQISWALENQQAAGSRATRALRIRQA